MKPKRTYVGFSNGLHDSALAIVDAEGRVVFAEATERVVQQKRAVNVAPDLFDHTSRLLDRYCDPGSEIVLASSWSEEAARHTRAVDGGVDRSHIQEQLKQLFGEVPAPIRRQLSSLDYLTRSLLHSLEARGTTLEWTMQQSDVWSKSRLVRRQYDHHLTHAATGCFSSPFEEAVCAVFDGYGEGAATAFYRYREGRLEAIEPQARGEGSLGMFYGNLCDAAGFGSFSGEEWKVMGLAAYGEHDEELHRLLSQQLKVDGLRLDFAPSVDRLRISRKLERYSRQKGSPALSVANLAHVGQRIFEDTLVGMLETLHARTGIANLVLCGGCALNSSANGKILDRTSFSALHVYSAPADDGNAIGAALLAHQEDHPEAVTARRFSSPYLGSRLDPETVENVKRFSRIERMTLCEDAPKRAAGLLAEGKIIGWVQGRAEVGPRALGNRSILADPRSPDIKDIINARVKFREEFRPFAPSILHEHGPEYFEHYQESPYMERTLAFRTEVRGRVPGVVHEDGTGRLQSVKKEANERYWRLIHEFHALTGVPLVLNTSFNVMGKPIAHSVEDVLSVFFSSGLDAVFMDDLLIEKPAAREGV